MTTALKRLKIDRVAIVDRPANPEALHVLAKRDADTADGADGADDVAKAADAGPSRRGKRTPAPMPPRMTDDMVSDPDMDGDDDETTAGDMDHDMAKLLKSETIQAASFEDIQERIRAMLNTAQALAPYVPCATDYTYVVQTFPDHVIVNRQDNDNDGDGGYWRVPYSLNADGEIVLGKPVQVEQSYTPVGKRDFSADERTALADKGHALPDGSYPIETVADLKSALTLARSGHGDVAAARRLIVRRARALGATDLLPPDWRVAKTAATKETDAMTGTPAPATAETEPVTKADLEAVRKQYEDQLAQVSKSLEETTARAVQAESVAKAEADAREVREAIAKAERDYPVLPGTTPVETGALVRAIGKVADAESVAKLETLLASASAAIAKGDLFAEHGRSGGAAADGPVAKLEAIAKGLRSGDGALTDPQAFAKAVAQNPELAAEYRKQFVPTGGYAQYR